MAPNNTNSGNSAGSQSASTQSSTETRTVEGKIHDLRSIDLQNAKRERARHHLVRLEFLDGRTTIVNLGPKFFETRRRLSIGNIVQITGTPGKIQNRTMLFAQKVRLKKAELNDPSAQNNSQQNSPAEKSRVSKVQLRGVVEDSHRAFLYPDGQAQPLLRVRLENGRSALVDLGPNTSVADLELKENASVVIYGTPAFWDGQQIIRADMVAVNGDTTVLR